MKRIVIVTLVAILMACSDPHSTVISTANSDSSKMQEAMKKLSEDESKLVLGYMLRTTLSNPFSGKADLPLGVTSGGAIKIQNAWLEEQKTREAEAGALKRKLLAERETAEKLTNEAVAVTLVSKKLRAEYGVSGILMDQHLDARVDYKNNIEKTIAGASAWLCLDRVKGNSMLAFYRNRG